jgi:hypothetical protein
MAEEEYGKVVTTFWRDRKVRPLEREARYLLLYWFTCPSKNMAGLFYCPLETAALETGLDTARVRELTLGPLSPFVTYDEETSEILVHRMVRRAVGESIHPADKRLKGVASQVGLAQSDRLRAAWHQLHRDWVHGGLTEGDVRDFEGPSEAPSKPVTVAVTEAVTGTVAESTAGAGREVRPSVRVAVAANLALRANSRLAGRFNELLPQQAEVQVHDWLEAGIPLELICETVSRVCRKFSPSPGREQPVSFAYFDRAVREAFAKAHGRAELHEAATDGAEHTAKTPKRGKLRVLS